MTEPSPSTTNYCTATRRDGERCQAVALPGDAFCYTHSPERAEERAEARARGGKNRSTTARMRKAGPPGLTGLCGRLEEVLSGVLDGTIEPKIATAAATVAGCLIRAYQVGEAEARIAEIERVLKERGVTL